MESKGVYSGRETLNAHVCFLYDIRCISCCKISNVVSCTVRDLIKSSWSFAISTTTSVQLKNFLCDVGTHVSDNRLIFYPI